MNKKKAFVEVEEIQWKNGVLFLLGSLVSYYIIEAIKTISDKSMVILGTLELAFFLIFTFYQLYHFLNKKKIKYEVQNE